MRILTIEEIYEKLLDFWALKVYALNYDLLLYSIRRSYDKSLAFEDLVTNEIYKCDEIQKVLQTLRDMDEDCKFCLLKKENQIEFRMK